APVPDRYSTPHPYPQLLPHYVARLSCRARIAYSKDITQCSEPRGSRAREGGATMGDLEQSSHGTAQGARLPAELLSPAEVPELPEWSARARRPLTEARILKAVGTGTLASGRVMALHRTALTRARLYAHHLRLLATFFREDPEVRGRPEDADLSALKIAAGLRCTFDQAWSQVRDARTAVEIMPLTFEYLRR